MMQNENGDENRSWHGRALQSLRHRGGVCEPRILSSSILAILQLRGAPVRRVSKTRVPSIDCTGSDGRGSRRRLAGKKQGSSASQGLGLDWFRLPLLCNEENQNFRRPFWIPDPPSELCMKVSDAVSDVGEKCNGAVR